MIDWRGLEKKGEISFTKYQGMCTRCAMGREFFADFKALFNDREKAFIG